MSEPTYVYGVCRGGSELPGDLTGINGAPLERVAGDGIDAIVSRLPDEDLELRRDAMTEHARVLEAALTHGTVLPMRFGVVMDGDTAVTRDLLEAHGDELRHQLTELNGKVELRIRATYEEEPLMREILTEDTEIARMREEVRKVPEAAAHFTRIALGERIAEAVARKRQGDADWILEALTPLAIEVSVGEPRHERMVLAASFLVEGERMTEFDETVDMLGRAQAGRMKFRYTGPLPPHSFVQLNTTAEAPAWGS